MIIYVNYDHSHELALARLPKSAGVLFSKITMESLFYILSLS